MSKIFHESYCSLFVFHLFEHMNHAIGLDSRQNAHFKNTFYFPALLAVIFYIVLYEIVKCLLRRFANLNTYVLGSVPTV